MIEEIYNAMYSQNLGWAFLCKLRFGDTSYVLEGDELYSEACFLASTMLFDTAADAANESEVVND